MKIDSPPIHDVDIKLLRIFKCVVDCAGFSASEEALGIGRSTISKYISDLEARLGVRLCERGRSGFQVSADGRTVYQATVELLDSLERFRSQVSTAKVNLSGDLSLWLMDNTLVEANNPVLRALSLFKARPGNVLLTVNAGAPDAVEQAVMARRAHVGLTISRSDLPGLTYQLVAQEHASLYCAQLHELFDLSEEELHRADLGTMDYVTRGYLVSEPSVIGERRRSSAIALHVEAAVQLILTGRYLGVLPDHIAERWLERGQLRRLPYREFRTTTPINIVLRDGTQDTLSVKALVDDIARCYSEMA